MFLFPLISREAMCLTGTSVNVLSDLLHSIMYHQSMSFLELTESGFSEQEDVLYENMKFLKEYGFTLSMDDFGTGYSTMTMLKTSRSTRSR